MSPALPAYGMTANPYEKRILNPSRTPADENLVARVDGCRRLDEIVAAITRDPDESSFAVIVGGSGSGRTSVANFLVHRWAQWLGHDNDRLLFVRKKALHYDAPNLMKETLLTLRNTIEGAAIDISDTLQQLFDNIEGTDTGLAAVYQRVAIRLRRELGEAYRISIIIENVKESRIVDLMTSTFGSSGALMVFTADDLETTASELRIAVNGIDDISGDMLRLTQLFGQDVKDLAVARWSPYSRERVPFDLDAVAEVVGEIQRPLGRTLAILAQLLDFKQLSARDGASWPQDSELALTRQEIIGALRFIESNINTGGAP